MEKYVGCFLVYLYLRGGGFRLKGVKKCACMIKFKNALFLY